MFTACPANTFVTGYNSVGIKTCTLYADLINQVTGVRMPGSQLGDTLYYNGTDWVRSSNIYNDGTNVGIGGTGAPTSFFEIKNGGNTYMNYRNTSIGIGRNTLLNTS
jgi:hypothetical protein